MGFYVYILLCVDGSFYTGYTKNIDTRTKLHENGNGAKYTKVHKPKKIVYVEYFDSRGKAMKREMQIKKLSLLQKLKIINSQNNDRKQFMLKLSKITVQWVRNFQNIINVNANPVIIGIVTLSFIGRGRYSTIIAIAAPINAIIGIGRGGVVRGSRKTVPAKKAKINPAKEPSKVLPLLKGKRIERIPPKIEAALSPKANIAIATLLAGIGKRTRVNAIPKA